MLQRTHLVHSCSPSGGKAIKIWSTDGYTIGTQRKCLGNIDTAPNTTVKNEL